ncbi:MAG: class I SAM-dependent methyltransferase [Actinobacteria bacterium]|nr:class I SAM-dependent methyltransferase [Actinomycetota bacterium]MCA1720941.1 class I SAM-dependent methyltransferase [Actinomycetota bacterium]
MTSAMPPAKQSVANFWEAEACGERYGADQDRLRYELEPEILRVARFDSGRGQRVLEIGVGMGSDLVRWARAGARVTGVDLTARAVELSRERLAGEGLEGTVTRADAEHLPFADGTFDVIWSWGVLHHTPDADRALVEATRVLRVGGRYAVMVYHRHSWLALAAWARWGVLRGRPTTTLRQAVAHVESPGTRAYTSQEVRDLLDPHLESLVVRPVLTHWDRRVAPVVSRAAGDRLGWFLVVEGVRR